MGNIMQSPEKKSGSALMAFLPVNVYLELHLTCFIRNVEVVWEQIKIMRVMWTLSFFKTTATK